MREQARLIIDNTFTKFLLEQKRIVEDIFIPNADIIKNIENLMKPSIEEFQKLVEAIQKSVQEFPPQLQQALITLAGHGWYIDVWGLPIPSIGALKNALLRGEIEIAEKTLIEYYDERIDVIESYIIGRFKHRAEIIAAAFAAHKRGEYIMSIPVFFAQTDGICKEIAGRYLFIKKEGRPEIAVYVEQYTTDRLWRSILQPLAQHLPIVYS